MVMTLTHDVMLCFGEWRGAGGCRDQRCSHKSFFGRFVLLSLPHGTGAPPALTQDWTFLDFSYPGVSVLSKGFSAFQVKSKAPLGGSQGKPAALSWGHLVLACQFFSQSKKTCFDSLMQGVLVTWPVHLCHTLASRGPSKKIEFRLVFLFNNFFQQFRWHVGDRLSSLCSRIEEFIILNVSPFPHRLM